MGLGVLEIHSRKSQPQRNKVSEQFREGCRLVMFTSDVSARGMDYPDVSMVIQVGQPADKAQYIHRLGRTARAGKEGCGVLLLCDFERHFMREVKDLPLSERQYVFFWEKNLFLLLAAECCCCVTYTVTLCAKSRICPCLSASTFLYDIYIYIYIYIIKNIIKKKL